MRGICFAGPQASSHPVTTYASSAQLVLHSAPFRRRSLHLGWQCVLFPPRPTPRCHARRLDVVDQLYDQLVSVLSWQSPRQRVASHRRTPFWWTHECFSGYVARNGVRRDCRRDPTPILHAGFRAARLAFHHTVRSLRRSFGSQWQCRVSSLSGSLPRLAASVIRRTFHGPTDSRGDQSDQVRWSLDGNSSVTQQEVLENWRRHFASVGASRPGSFGKDFFVVVSARFIAVRSV